MMEDAEFTIVNKYSTPVSILIDTFSKLPVDEIISILEDSVWTEFKPQFSLFWSHLSNFSPESYMGIG